ncbi:MAG TPA: nickel pincer cofactor biosynthesis protein LarC [Actinomycetes bacterium]
MTLAWFQCPSGASGDMLLGALLDAGAPLDAVQSALDAVGVEPIEVTVRTVQRGGLAAAKADVRAAEAARARTWADVRRLLAAAALPEQVRGRALDVFSRLAAAEARAHRIPADDVHFHEVGALDAIADIVGVSAALHALGVTTAACQGVALGSGTVRAAHGVLPVPAPAVAELLAEVGAPVWSGPADVELCTPTGAALLASVVTHWGPTPPGRIRSRGYGAGERELDGTPNLLGVLLLEPMGAPEEGADGPTQLVLAANVDDLDPRIWPVVLTRLLDAGAADAWITPIVMKKGRPAHTVTVLVDPAAAEAVRRVLFTETSTIGLREHEVTKRALQRHVVTVRVLGHPVRVKVAELHGEEVNAQPEFEDVAAAAEATGRPVKAVLAAALAAVHGG